MKVLYVLIMMSWGPGPTWTVSTPVTQDECYAMEHAIRDFVKEQDSGTIFGPGYAIPKRLLTTCRKVIMPDETPPVEL